MHTNILEKNVQPRFRQFVEENYSFFPAEEQMDHDADIEAMRVQQERDIRDIKEARKKHFAELEHDMKEDSDRYKHAIFSHFPQSKLQDINDTLKSLLQMFNNKGKDIGFNSIDDWAKREQFGTDALDVVAKYVICIARLTILEEVCTNTVRGDVIEGVCTANVGLGLFGSDPPKIKDLDLITSNLMSQQRNIVSGWQHQPPDIITDVFMLHVWSKCPLLNRKKEKKRTKEGDYVTVWDGKTTAVNGLEYEKAMYSEMEYYDTSQYGQVFDEFMSLQAEEWHTKHKEPDYKCVPNNPFMLFYFMFDSENIEDLHPGLRKLVNSIQKNISPQYFGERTEMDLFAFETAELQEYPYGNHKASINGDDFSQGLVFSGLGKRVFVLLLATVAVHSYEFDHFKIDFDSKSLVQVLLQTYEWICMKQEKYLKGKAEKIPWSLSEWGASGGVFPQFLSHQPQSLEYLNIRIEAKKPVCSACAKQFQTYYGAKWSGVNKKRGYDESSINKYGLCTQYVTLDSILELSEEEKNNPWYLNWVGTWEQAHRRLQSYKRKQDEMYNNSDPNYSFVAYYTGLWRLQLDFWIKKVFNICNVQVDDSDDHLKKLSPEEEEEYKWVDADMSEKGWWESIKGAAGSMASSIGSFLTSAFGKLYGTVKELLRVGGILLYKMISMVLSSPMCMEGLIYVVSEYQKKMCITFHAKTARILRTSDGEMQELTPYGEFVTMSKQDKAQVEMDEAEKLEEKWKKEVSQFFAVLQEMGGLSGESYLQTIIEGSYAYINGAFAGVASVLMSIPVLGNMLEKAGFDDEKLTKAVMCGMLATGKKNFSAMIQANASFNRLQRLYDAVIKGSKSCLDSTGNLTIKDGGMLGEGAQYLNYAWEALIFNIPYYAIMLLNEAAKSNLRTPMHHNGIEGTPTPEFRKLINGFLITQQVAAGIPAVTSQQKEANQEPADKYKELRDSLDKKLELELAIVDYTRAQQKNFRGNDRFTDNGNKEAFGSKEAFGQMLSNSQEIKEAAEKYKSLQADLSTKLVKQHKDDAQAAWNWWACAFTIAAVVGVIVLTGGAAAIVATVSQAAGAAATGAYAAASSAAAAIASSSAGVAAASAGSSIAAGATTAGTFIAANSGTIISSGFAAYNSQSESAKKDNEKIVMLAGAWLFWRGIDMVYQAGKHWNDKYHTYPIRVLFEKRFEWQEIFHARLNQRLLQFSQSPEMEQKFSQGDTPRVEHIRSIELRKVMAKNRSLTIDWSNPTNMCQYLKLDDCINLFLKYGEPIV